MKKMFVVFAVMSLLLAVDLMAQAPPVPSPVSITLVWDANPPDQEVAEYRVYQASEATGPWGVIATVTNTTHTVELPGGPARRFWYVTAVNFWDQESLPSNTVNTPAPTTPSTGLRVMKDGGQVAVPKADPDYRFVLPTNVYVIMRESVETIPLKPINE